jgi:segregation and condensation protein A
VPYEVHLDVYTGPFDLLLQLITAQELDLYEIELTEIVDGFVREIARLEAIDLESTTEFLLLAATLIELKCKRLLPGSDEIELDEELSLYEVRDYLLARLVEAKMFSEAGRALQHLEHSASRAHPRRAGADERFANTQPDLLLGVTAERIAALGAKALADRPVPVVEVAHIHTDEVSVHDTFARLVVELPTLGRTTLREISSAAPTTAAFVAIFLALLELYKQELVDLDQIGTFGDVTISWIGGGQRGAGPADEYDMAVPTESNR